MDQSLSEKSCSTGCNIHSTLKGTMDAQYPKFRRHACAKPIIFGSVVASDLVRRAKKGGSALVLETCM